MKVHDQPWYVSGVPKAGWYADPIDGERLRWWDGSEWTALASTRQPPIARRPEVQPQPAVAPAPAVRPRLAVSRRTVIVAGAALAALVASLLFVVRGGSGAPAITASAKQSYLNAVHRDAPSTLLDDKTLVAYGTEVCGDYAHHLPAAVRIGRLDRTGIVSVHSDLPLVWADALIHLCPQYNDPVLH